MLNTPAFKQYLFDAPSNIMETINEIMIKFLKNESTILYQDLMDYIQIFSTETTELTQYIEQSNAFRKLKNEFPSLEKKVDNLESVASLFDGQSLQQIYVDTSIKVRSGYNEAYPGKSVLITESIEEVRKCLDLLPELFLKVKRDLDKGRENLATKVIKTSQMLSEMIEKFESAYIDNFHVRASTKKPKDILANIQSKSKTLDDISKKSELFKDSLEFLKSEGDKKVMETYPDLVEFECQQKVAKMTKIHEVTVKAWQYISIWQERVSKIHESNLKIIESILKLISECTVFNDKLNNKYPELYSKFKPTMTSMLQYQFELDFWHEIQQTYMKDRHWFEI